MDLSKARFAVSAASPRDFPDVPWPEVAFAGRSNVGKSSFINTITGQKKLAKTSASPGRTQTINFFNVQDKAHLVDLPGYGFAKVPKSMKERWTRLIEGYLQTRLQLVAVVLLIDIRHTPTKDDVTMANWLAQSRSQPVVVATKADKISKGQIARQMAQVKRTLGLDCPYLAFSAKDGRGRNEAVQLIVQILEQTRAAI